MSSRKNQHVTKPAADAALSALFADPTSAESVGQFLADVVGVTEKMTATTSSDLNPRIGQVLIAVGHAVAKNANRADLEEIASSDITWDDITAKLQELGLINKSDAAA